MGPAYAHLLAKQENRPHTFRTFFGSPQEFVKLTIGGDLSVLASLGLVGASGEHPARSDDVEAFAEQLGQ